MQMSLARFGADAEGGPAMPEGEGGGSRAMAEEDAPGPIEIDISEGWERTGVAGLFHNAAEFLIISITGCEPRR
ncbi:MAG: hypothetical protein WC861_03870 [Candidatus Micrarchaeia archaeon]